MFWKNSLMGKLILMFLLVSILPLITLGVLFYYQSRNSLEHQIYQKLRMGLNLSVSQLERMYREIQSDLLSLSKTPIIWEQTHKLGEYRKKSKGNDIYNLKNTTYKNIHDRLDAFLSSYARDYGHHDIILVDPQKGDVMYTLGQEEDHGTNLITGPYKDTPLAKIWKKVKAERTLQVENFSYYEPTKGIYLFMGVPVVDQHGETHAILVIQKNMNEINEAMMTQWGDEKTTDKVLVTKFGDKVLYLNTIRFDPNSAFKRTNIIGSNTGLPAQEAALGKSGEGLSYGYRKTKGERTRIIAAWQHIPLTGWGLVSKQDYSEAFAPIFNLRTQLILLGLIIATIVIILAYIISKRISDPIKTMANAASEISKGKLKIETKLPKERNDEIGILSRTFLEMVDSLKKLTTEIIEGVNVLSSSASEILSTAMGMTSSTQQITSSISETTTTIEQAKQTASISTQQAEEVSKSALVNSEISKQGLKSTQDTVEEMNRIKSQMSSVGENIINLSEQAQSIRDIVSAVDDLAEQSNLLAVNASIEAAKAADQGKGFTVLAHEIKNLAEQSKGATQQIRNILNNIQKATNSAVMITEEGDKAVDAGLKQSMEAGQSIRSLTQSIEEAANSAIQIASSSKQQLQGMDQIVAAMESIKSSGEQNLNNARNLESATKGIKELGQRLDNLVQQFTI